MISDRVMQWLARHFGKRVDWNGPTVFGHGYIWCGKVWFPPQDNSKTLTDLERRRQTHITR